MLTEHQLQALSHPVRLHMIGLVTQDPSRPLTVQSFHADLLATGEYPNLSLASANYHAAILRDACVIGWP
jgi:hypothetical protein